jgi:hypothetical protein
MSINILIAIVLAYFAVDCFTSESVGTGFVFLLGSNMLVWWDGVRAAWERALKKLPKHGELTEEDIDHVIEFVRQNSKGGHHFVPEGLVVTRDFLKHLVKYGLYKYTILDPDLKYPQAEPTQNKVAE